MTEFMHGIGTDEPAAIGLRYATDQSPGFTRCRRGRGFMIVDPGGSPVKDPHTIERIQGLAIPPAWTQVWICKSPDGHIQATGRDAKNRKQVIYHHAWVAHRDQVKFDRLREFGEALPAIRARVEKDLSVPGLPKNKVVAVVVRLLETSLIRVGNSQYVRENGSFGLTTFENRHAKITSSILRFAFKGKSGKFHEISVNDRRLASIVRRCQELPGQALFEFLDHEKQAAEVTSADVNQYLRSASGSDFTAKEFRTWAATVEAIRCLRELGDPTDAGVREVVKQVAKKLGNTPAVSRASYIHPAAITNLDDCRWLTAKEPARCAAGLSPTEQLVLDEVLDR